MRRYTWKSTGVLTAGVLLALGAGFLPAPPAAAQSAFSADGVVESKSGGFKFPDGSVQAGAAVPLGDCPTLDPSDEMIWVGGVCIDKYEASIWDEAEGGNQITGIIPCSHTGQDCDNIWARSVAGVEPRGAITWFQAQAALANSGKRLPTNAEWQIAVRGTPDSDSCNIDQGAAVDTGSLPDCVSDWGAFDMVGNVWEWVADWDEQAAGCETWPAAFGGDGACMGRMDADVNNHFPGALLRGGGSSNGTFAGAFQVSANTRPSSSGSRIGFRGAR